jgi:hypothetical protein
MGRPTAQLFYQPGYYADKVFSRFTAADKERQLEDALLLNDPITEIPMAMEVNYFQLNRAEYFVPVSVKIPRSDLSAVRRRGDARASIDLIGEVKDSLGVTQQNVRDKLDIELTRDTAVLLSTHPIQYETAFTLLPGTYRLKILARDAATGRIGTHQTEFTIPNLNREDIRLPISSVVLGSRQPLADAVFNSKGFLTRLNPLARDGYKLMPSVTRVFSKSRDMHVFLQAYQRNAGDLRPLVAYATFSAGDQRVYETPIYTVTSGLQEPSRAVPVSFRVSLLDLAPGMYECQITVLEPESPKVAFWRAPVVIVD